MSAAERSYIPVPVPKTKRQRWARSSKLIRPTPSVVPSAPVIPVTPPVAPPSFHFLSLLEKVVSVVTFSLLGSTLGIYAWTVYIPKVWDREFQKLETLQRYERQLLATNETIKHQLAEQAEKPETGFRDPQPFQTIFLHRASADPIKPIQPSKPSAAEIVSRTPAY